MNHYYISCPATCLRNVVDARAGMADHVDEPFLAEQILVPVMSLRDTVGVQHHRVARGELHRLLHEREPDREPVGAKERMTTCSGAGCDGRPAARRRRRSRE